MKYSAEELRGLGLTEEQIETIQNTYKNEVKDLSNIEVKPFIPREIPRETNVRDIASSSLTKVTTIEDLKEYAKGQIVQLPPFADGQPLIVRMKRPSLMILAKSGKIPNKLLKTATEMFNGEKSTDDEDFDALSKTLELLEIICEASLVEPKYKDFKSAGIDLSDEQLIAIFNYTQRGIEALNSFH